MTFIDLISKKVYAALVAALLLALLACGGAAVWLKLDLAHAQTQYAQLQAQSERDAKERERVGREHAQTVAKDEFRHAEIQQENVHAFQAQVAADRDRDRSRDNELARLRNDIAAYANRGAEREADAATCRSELDRSRRLGADLEEALGLQGEAESFIRQRDREVKLLLDTVHNDRKLGE